MTVPAGGVKLEDVRDPRGLQRGMVDFAAGDVGLVVLAVDDEGGREAGFEVEIQRGAALFVVKIGRANQHGKVRPAA